MAIILTGTLVRVQVTEETLERIADLLKIPRVHRDRMLKGGIFIAAPPAVRAVAGAGTQAASRSRGTRALAVSRTASRTGTRATTRTTSRTTRQRK